MDLLPELAGDPMAQALAAAADLANAVGYSAAKNGTEHKVVEAHDFAVTALLRACAHPSWTDPIERITMFSSMRRSTPWAAGTRLWLLRNQRGMVPCKQCAEVAEKPIEDIRPAVAGDPAGLCAACVAKAVLAAHPRWQTGGVMVVADSIAVGPPLEEPAAEVEPGELETAAA